MVGMDVLKENLNTNLFKLTPGTLVLVKTPLAKHLWVSVGLLDILLNTKKHPGTYISLGKPHVNVKKAMEFNGFKHDNLTFVDTIGKVGMPEKKGKRVHFVDGPYNLSLLFNTISRAFEGDREISEIPMDSNLFFLMDNLDDIVFYNEPDTIVDFTMNFIDMMKSQMKLGIMLFHNENSPVFIALKSQANEVFVVNDDWF